jgi:RHS repeat-associated protein
MKTRFAFWTALGVEFALGTIFVRAELPPVAEGAFDASMQSRTVVTNRIKYGTTPDSIGCTQACPDQPRMFKTVVTTVNNNFTLDTVTFAENVSTTVHWSSGLVDNIVSLSGTMTCAGENYTCSGYKSLDTGGSWVWTESTNPGVTNTDSVGCCSNMDPWASEYASESQFCEEEIIHHFVETLSDGPYGYVGTNEVVNSLSDEYTTGELIAPPSDPYADNWAEGSKTADAFSSIADTELSADVGKMQFRFRVLAPAGQQFQISYTVHYADDNGYYTNWDEQIIGTGTGQYAYYPQGGPIEYLPPYVNSGSGSCTNYIGARKWATIACASLGGGGGGGCQSCKKTPGSWQAENTEYGLRLSASLGSDSYGDYSGSLTIASSTPNTDITSPAGLNYSGGLSDVVTIMSSGNLRQVKSSLMLADVITSSASSYQIRLYSDPGSSNSTTHLYEPPGSPFSTTTIEQIGSTNHVRVTIANGTTSVHDYEWSDANKGWTLISGGGIRKEEFAWNESALARTNTTRNASDQIVFQQIGYYTDLTNSGRVITRRVVGPSGPALTTRWFYYENPATDGTNYGLLKLMIEPTGFWKKYEYDTNNRVTKITSQFLNAATNAADNLCRVMEIDYTPVAAGCSSERRVEKLLGQEISREYALDYGPERRTIHCLTPGTTNLAASDNLVSITKFYPSGSFVGRLMSVSNVDGTMQIYSYATNSTEMTNIICSGQPGPYGTNIVDGTMTITVNGALGEILLRKTIDIASSPRITLSSESYSYNDDIKLSYTVTSLDGLSRSVQYACCGVDNTVEKDGALTTYLYDGLRRQTASMRNGITVTNVLDAAGNTLQTVRIGTDASRITNSSSVFDVAGRLVWQTNALGGATSFTNVVDGSGQTIVTNKYPDGGARIETRYQDGNLQKITGTAAFPIRYAYGVMSESGTQRVYTAEIKLDGAGADTSECITNFTDMAGRVYKTFYAAAQSPYPSNQVFYNNLGQAYEQIDPDGVITLSTFNGKGEQEYSVIDMNQNGAIDLGGTDRITRTVMDAHSDGGIDARRTLTYVWPTNSSTNCILAAMTRVSTDGLRVWRSVNGVTNSTVIVYDPPNGYRYVTNTAQNGSYSVAITRYGTNVCQKTFDSTGAQILGTTFLHDTNGRPNRSIDARNGGTTNWFNEADQISSTKTPSPDGTQAGLVTTNFFDQMGHQIGSLLPDSTTVTNQFGLSGLVTNISGSRVYPVYYTYDSQGRLKTMTTWKNYAGNSGAATTTWNYNQYRGWLDNKRYADNTGPNYTNSPAGRRQKRLWARGVLTTYNHDNAGDVSSTSYSDSTPGVDYTFDRRGRTTGITQGTHTTTRLLDDAGNILSDAYSDGVLSGLTISNNFDAQLRSISNGVWNGSAWLTQSKFMFDNASRLHSVSDGTNSATYSYLANSRLVSQIGFTNNATGRMVTTKQYDFLNRLTNISSMEGATSVASFAYPYNTANQRTSVTNADGSYWVYSYDNLGQVTAGVKHWSDGTPVAAQQFSYAFDDIGNRISAAAGGDDSGFNLRTSTYSANALNQYTNRTVPGYVNVVGSASTNAIVTIWGSDGSVSATSRRDNYYRGELAVDNSTNALWLIVTNVAVIPNDPNPDIVTNTIGSTFVPKTPEAFYFDADGNQLSDGRWTNTWNAENRLIQMVSLTNAPSGSKLRLRFSYDSQGRRITKQVESWTGSNWSVTTSNKFLYNGWNLIAELNGTNNSLIRSYIWGTDLSGSRQGAGGVGGLIAENDTVQGVLFAAFDGNGNVSALLKAIDGAVSANYEYGPFGEITKSSGPMSNRNRVRFSTIYQDSETDLICYGDRYYTVDSGRWQSRDTIEERGGVNIYCFVRNSPTSTFDVLGRAPGDVTDEAVTWDPPASKCAKGLVQVFIQVGVGGFGPYSSFVDDGSAGYYATGTGCPEYPNFGFQGHFGDTPGGLTGPVRFITCAACARPCQCTPNGGQTFTRQIETIWKCVTWKKGDTGSILSSTGDRPPFEPTTEEDMLTFLDVLTKKYPTYNSKCYTCLHKKKR